MFRSLAVLLLMPAAALADETPFLPLVAHGEEPGWLLRAAAEGIVLTLQLGTTFSAPLPAPEPLEDGGVRYPAPRVGFEVRPALCHDTMTGMPYPLSVTLLEGTRGTGCGGEPLSLLQGEWRVTRAEDETPPARASLTVEGRRLSGHSGCNRFVAALEPSAEGLRIGPAASTRMACPGPLMTFEQRLLAALSRVTRFDLDAEGRLLLIEDERPVVVAER